MSGPIALGVPPELLDAIATRVADELERRGATSTPPNGGPWLDVDEAAVYLRCKPQRVYDLVAAGELRPAKDGRRSLFRREWLDDYLTRSEAA